MKEIAQSENIEDFGSLIIFVGFLPRSIKYLQEKIIIIWQTKMPSSKVFNHCIGALNLTR